MLSLLADVSGIAVHTVEIAEAIAPASNTNNTNNFSINLINFFIYCHKKTRG
jgi:hypothetical protein